MSLSQDLQRYIDSKSNTSFNQVKRTFFTEIILLIDQNQLTATTLTDKLAALSTDARSQLFYRRLLQGPSPSSEAAQWIKTLYQALKVPLSDLDLSVIVAEGLDKKNQTALKQCAYKHWQANKLSPGNIRTLEHELKGLLGLSNGGSRELSLASAMKKSFDDLATLEDKLDQISKFSPDYLEEIINNLAEEYGEGNEEFIKAVVDISNKKQQFFPYFLKSNSYIAAALVKENRSHFFQLSASMQRAVLSRFDKTDKNAIHDIFIAHDADDDDQLSQVAGFFDLFANGDFLQAASKAGHGANDKFNQYHGTIKAKLQNGIELANEHQKLLAIKAIDNYLKQAPNNYKTTFFKKLKEDIQNKGLTTGLLQEHLQSTSRAQLFSKWSGMENSRACALVKDLYTKATFGLVLADLETQEMFNKGKLPQCSEADLDKQREKLINDKVTQILLYPTEARFTGLGQEIQRNVHYDQSHYRIIQHTKANWFSGAEAIYQNYIIQKGLKQAEQDEEPSFDPQGHVIVTVELVQSDLVSIYNQIQDTCYSHITDREDNNNVNADTIASLIGAEKISLATVCNLDIAEHENLKRQFKARILRFNDENLEMLDKAVDSLLSSPHRSSVIALQEEMTLHASLSLRVLEKSIQEHIIGFQPLPQEARNQLFQEINNEVLTHFSHALSKSYTQERGIHFATLNRELDKARASLAPNCRELLVSTLLRHIDDDQHQEITGILATLNDHAFTSSTATGLDYLRTDAGNHTVVRISGTDNTAHDKVLGAQKQALRLLSRNHYDAGQESAVKPHAQMTQEARVPSLDIINGIQAEVVGDIAAKLKHSRSVLTAKAAGVQGPMVYNLLTSLHTKAYDCTLFENKNKQRQGAMRILLGSHVFNREQVQRSEPYNLVYVQNIPVNQHTNQLDNYAFDDATAEATVMTDMALMSTFYYRRDLFPPSLRNSIGMTFADAHSCYVGFLKTANGINYFKDSAQGKYVIADLEKKKALWANLMEKFPEKSNSLQTLALHALFKMMVTNDYRNKQFGMLAQSLSVFLEPLSQAGCKSANERYQAVAGRVELLKSLSESAKRRPEQQAVFDSLKKYICGDAPVEGIQAGLDRAYNRYNLQGSAAVFSEEDQGASSKVKATSNRATPGKVSEFDTNVAESGYLTLLFQQFSGAMQAHKAHLARAFRALFASKAQVRDENSMRLRD
jgi:hypothetical protein